MFNQPATCAAELGLRDPTSCVDTPAGVARLRAVSGWYLDEGPAVPGELVLQALDQAPPSSIEDALGKAVVGLDHVFDLELLNNDRAVALGVGGAEILNEVFTLSSNLAVDACNAELGFLPVFGSFLPARDGALRTDEPLHGSGVEPWGFDDGAVGVSNEVDHATVQRDDRLYAERRVSDLDLANDRDEPLVTIAADRAGLRLFLKRPVDHRSQIADLREADRRAVDAPTLGVWLTDPEAVATLVLPARHFSETGETSLPRFIQIQEELGTNVAGHICEPRKFGAESGQFVDLVKGCQVSLVGPGESHEPLFVGKVPEEAQRIFPSTQTDSLFGCWVDAVAEAFVDAQGNEYSSRYVKEVM